LVATVGKPGEVYNVGSGHVYPVRWLLETLLSLSPATVELAVDPARLRPSDIPITMCDSSRLRQATGWQPRIDLRDSLRDLLEDWRAETRGARADG
jgi:GDP-4-dehydro-6-deoxy-D-mannose reductase